jgi:hypothetical protein
MRSSGTRRRIIAAVAAAVGVAGMCVAGPAQAAQQRSLPLPVPLIELILRLPLTLFPFPFNTPHPVVYPTLSVGYTQGKGAPSPTSAGPCTTLLVEVTGHEFPPSLYGTGRLDFYNEFGARLDYAYYSWNPQGTQSQVLAVIRGTAIQSATATPDRTVTVIDASDPAVSVRFPLECS